MHGLLCIDVFIISCSLESRAAYMFLLKFYLPFSAVILIKETLLPSLSVCSKV